ncbi:Uncharacterised protein [Chromobacterium violaceum]|uniref:Uncharacterized protein n=1 Tax=Chromobacterium violaceum TaxID=536 RepID=A0A3S4I6V2_CHRVL|nr:Uncharacterised protein [Chromobacterium violaceum]
MEEAAGGGRDEESNCYGQLMQLRQGQKPDNLDRFLEGKPRLTAATG